MFTAKTLELLLSNLPQAAKEAHRALGLTNNLLSVSAICDAGCEVFFNSTGCEVSFNGEIILRGWRDFCSNMWRVSLVDDGAKTVIPDDSQHITNDHSITNAESIPDFFANSIYKCENTDQLIKFYHVTMGFPNISTWCKAINAGYFRGWPSLTSKRVRQVIKIVDKTEMGHMDQQRKGLRSTKTVADETDSMEPIPQSPQNNRCHHVYMTIADIEGKLYSDQTGRFPVTSNRGNSYIVIFYTSDGNYIKSYPIKSRHRTQLLKACEEVYTYLRVRGYIPQLHKLDNETLKDVEAFVTEK